MEISSVVQKTFTVAEYIELLNIFFKSQEARIQGEVCESKVAASGHAYLTLKDKNGGGVLDCIIWRSTYALCGIRLEPGMEIVVTGHPNIYPQNGRLSFITSSVELVGEGALKKAYDALRAKLEAEGLLAESRKRGIPDYACRIGVITSREGAVIHDFINNLGKFGFKVSLADSRVEGQAAVRGLIAAVKTMKKEDIEVLVLIRGGGSFESLQGFNNEALIREVCAFPVPVIAGIGHDKDVPLVALAADAMVSTPTAAAHLVNRSWEEAYAKIREAAYLVNRMPQEFRRIRADLASARTALVDHASLGIQSLKENLANAEQAVRMNDPARHLKLGYAIVRREGRIVRSVTAAKTGAGLDIQLADGAVRSKVI